MSWMHWSSCIRHPLPSPSWAPAVPRLFKFFKSCIIAIRGWIDMEPKGWESIGCWSQVATLNFHLTHDLDLGFSWSNFYSIMMLVKFLTSANQKNRIWSCDKSRLCNPRPRLLGDEVVVGPSLMFRKMDPWNVIRNILQDKTNKNQL